MLINPYVDMLITNTFLADRDADLMDIMMVSTIEDVSGGARPCLSRKAQELLRQQKIPQLPFFVHLRIPETIQKLNTFLLFRTLFWKSSSDYIFRPRPNNNGPGMSIKYFHPRPYLELDKDFTSGWNHTSKRLCFLQFKIKLLFLKSSISMLSILL